MCPLFGAGNKRDPDAGDEVDSGSEVARLRHLAPEELAAEVIAHGFALDDSSDRGRASVHDMAQRMVPGILRESQDQIWALEELIGEGVQLLEHARLAQCTVVGADRRLQWVLTRGGRTAASDGSVMEVLAKLA
jgi:hypothetical protein